MDLTKTLQISASAMRAQGMRLRVVAENIANANSTGETPNDPPYRRQVVTFRNAFDREVGADTVRIGSVRPDPSEFVRRYEPGHPSADESGYVQYPNVNTLIEMMDMREAQRSYEANLSIIETSRTMLVRTIELLRA